MKHCGHLFSVIMGGLKRRKSAPHRHGKRKRFSARRAHKVKVSLDIVPKTLPRTFIYYDRISVSAPASGTLTEIVYVANDLRDPTNAVGGHQPYGFDQWMAWYDHFTVTKSKIEVTFAESNPNASIVHATQCCLRLDDAGDHELNPTLVMEMPGSKVLMLGSSNSKRLTKTFNARRFFGGASKIGSSEYKGNTTFSPTERAFFHIGLAGAESGSGSNIELLIKVTYTATLSERKEVPQS